MSEEILLIVILALCMFGFGLTSGRLSRSIITPPMAFVGAGLLVGALGLVHLEVDGEFTRFMVEITLALVLFTDASRIDFSIFRNSYGIPTRMLAIGMPLTLLLGTGVAMLLFDDLPLLCAAVLAAALMPTDAALGQAVVNNQRVPVRIRQALNVESGLNDGIALPVVLILISLASTAGGDQTVSFWTSFTARQVIFGPIVGVIVGWAGGYLISWSTRHDWIDENFERLSALALALLAFGAAELVGGNGFISAFVAGLTIGNTSRPICDCLYEFAEAEGALFTLLTFTVFGAVMVFPAWEMLDWRVVVYAALSLTVVRMLPIALSLLRFGLHRDTVIFLGWFGPRGLASILFGLLVLEAEAMPMREELFAVVVITVLLSVFAHGVSAYPAAVWYGNQAEAMADEPDMPELVDVPEMPTRSYHSYPTQEHE